VQDASASSLVHCEGVLCILLIVKLALQVDTGSN